MIFNESAQLEIREVARRGKSLFARRDFKKEDVVFVASGAIVSYPTDYTIPIDHALWIEPRIPGSHAQFLNHSCDPNVGVKNRTLFVAMRDIKTGEEVTTSYAFLGYEFGHELTLDGAARKSLGLTCKCGASNCVSKLQSYKEMPSEWRSKYKEFISDYLLDEARYPYMPA